MRWLLKPIMAPIARRKLDSLYRERIQAEQAIMRAKKAKVRVTEIYALSQKISQECLKWEQWT